MVTISILLQMQSDSMIDFHTHILPCIDDGSQSITESVSLLREEKRLGIDAVVATPHFYANENSPISFLKKRDQVWNQLKPYLWPELPRVYLGAEVQYFEGICSVEDIDLLRIQGTNMLLVEMPFTKWSDRMVEDILELNERQNMQVVLAHIERYMAMQPEDIWQYLRDCGILMQCNVSFFDGWKTKYRAMTMLKNGQIHLLGSDCHNMRSRRPNWDILSDKAWNMAKQSPAYDVLRNGASAAEVD